MGISPTLKILGGLLILVVIAGFQRQNSATYIVEVEITGLDENTGQMVIALFNDPEVFLKKDFKHVKVKDLNGKCIARFENLPEGKYAVSVFHDKNMNGELDSNMFGLPKEPYGFSNNAIGMFGPPDFEKSSFLVTGHKKVSIELR